MSELTREGKIEYLKHTLKQINKLILELKECKFQKRTTELEYEKDILERELKRLERDTSIQIPIIKTNNNIEQQLNKINSEREECLQEYFFYKKQSYGIPAIKYEEQIQLQALDVLTASLNLVNMLNIPQEVVNEHIEKMKRYETEKNYKIKKWVEIEMESESDE